MTAAAANAAAPPASPGSPPPIWPKVPIPVLGVTGKIWSGKTLFLLSIAPGPRTLIYDTEKSSESYQPQIGFDRIDVAEEMARLYPGGYKAIDLFKWWVGHVTTIPAGKYDVIALDVAEEFESGLGDYVWENPVAFGKTRNQFTQMEGIFWGVMKMALKKILVNIAAKCQTFAFANHMGKVWADKKPTSKDKPKGKSTFMELASLFLQMEREKDASGNVPQKPSAIVLKERLANITIGEDGELQAVSMLPPRLPVATPAAIKEYLRAKPRDPRAYTAEERAPAVPRSDDERADIKLETAKAEAEAERLRLERLHEEAKLRGGAATPAASEVADSHESHDSHEAASDDQAEHAEEHTATPAAEAVETAPPETPPAIVEASPLPASPPAKSSLPADDKTAVLQLFEEFCHIREMSHDAKDSLWKTVQTQCGVKDNRGLTKHHWADLRVKFTTAVKEAYKAKGIPDACPF